MLKKMRRFLAIGVTALILLSGCNGTQGNGGTPNTNNKTNENTNDSSQVSNETKTVTLGIWQGNEQEQASLDAVLNNIKEKHNIVVEKKVYTEYETQLKTDMAGRVAPDVFYLDAYVAPELISAGVIAPISESALDMANIDDFYPNLIDTFSQDGVLYGFPKDFSALALFYNETFLADAGYTADDIPENLEDWPVFLADLQSKLPSGVVALAANQELARLLSVLETSGTTINKEDGTSNLEDENFVKAVDFLGSMFNGGYMKTPKEVGTDWAGDSIGAGKAAIVLEGNWMIGHLNNNFPDLKYGTKEMPKYNGKNNSMLFSTAYAINVNSKDIEAANLLAYYLTEAGNMETWCSGAGVLPSRRSVSDAINIESDPIQANIIKGVEYAIPWQRGMTLSIINREFTNWFPKVCTGEITGAEAMAQATISANNDIRNLLQ